MNGVSALKYGDLGHRLEEILQADGAVAAHGVLHAAVRVFDLRWVAAATRVAVKIIVSTSHSTNAALVTMEDLLPETIIIPKVALWAEILSKLRATSFAILRRFLLVFTDEANHLGNLRSDDLVRSTAVAGSLIVAMATPIDLSTTRRNDLT